MKTTNTTTNYSSSSSSSSSRVCSILYGYYETAVTRVEGRAYSKDGHAISSSFVDSS